jgi:hypothetical protein
VCPRFTIKSIHQMAVEGNTMPAVPVDAPLPGAHRYLQMARWAIVEMNPVWCVPCMCGATVGGPEPECGRAANCRFAPITKDKSNSSWRLERGRAEKICDDTLACRINILHLRALTLNASAGWQPDSPFDPSRIPVTCAS